MTPPVARFVAAALTLGVALTTPAGAARAQAGPGAPASAAALRPGPTAADVQFMSGMIVHHAQAVLIAGWAPTHDAGAAVRRLCERIVVAQGDEIATMERWLREHGETVARPDPYHGMTMPGMDHPVLMPGMLTAEQLAQLDSARGAAFDRLFLTLMIQHHEGALTMVDRLLGAPGAAQGGLVFRFAADVHADQTTEIERMRTMVAALPPAPLGGPRQ